MAYASSVIVRVRNPAPPSASWSLTSYLSSEVQASLRNGVPWKDQWQLPASEKPRRASPLECDASPHGRTLRPACSQTCPRGRLRALVPLFAFQAYLPPSGSVEFPSAGRHPRFSVDKPLACCRRGRDDQFVKRLTSSSHTL